MRSGKPLLCLLALSLAAAGATGQEPETRHWTATTDAARERFLLEGRLVDRGRSAGGSTWSRRVTLSLDGFEHDVHVQTVDVFKPVLQLRTGPEFDFRDCYRHNVAAYRLDRLLGLGMVPVTVLRDYDLKEAAYTWWVDDVMMDLGGQSRRKVQPPDVECWSCQICVMRVFDQLIYNTDRNQGNLLIDKNWGVWMIDHTRAFKIFDDLHDEDALAPRCERGLLAALKRLDEPTLKTVMEDALDSGQIEGLLGRRDKIVKHYEARIAALGEDAVLCDLPSSAPSPESP